MSLRHRPTDYRRGRAIALGNIKWQKDLERLARVLFSDEFRLQLSFNDGWTRVWRRRGERFVNATVPEHNRSVMVYSKVVMSLSTWTPFHVIGASSTGSETRRSSGIHFTANTWCLWTIRHLAGRQRACASRTRCNWLPCESLSRQEGLASVLTGS